MTVKRHPRQSSLLSLAQLSSIHIYDVGVGISIFMSFSDVLGPYILR